MQEYWEITYERGVKSCAAWYSHPDYQVGTLAYGPHFSDVTNLPAFAAARTTAENTLTQKEAQRRTLLAQIQDIARRGPHVIKQSLPDGDDLLDVADGLLGIELEVEEDILRRAVGLIDLWGRVNVKRAALPAPEGPLPALTVVSMTRAAFATLQGGYGHQVEEVTAANSDVTQKKHQLRTLDRKADRNNKRWFDAWLNDWPTDSDEYALLATIPTEGGEGPPAKLEIETFAAQGDHSVQATAAVTGGAGADTRELQYRIVGVETNFGHSQPIALGELKTLGPFLAGQVIEARIRTANGHPGYILSDVKSAVA